MTQLTRRQQDVLAYLRDCAVLGYAPTLGEICDGLGLRSRGSLHKHVQALIDAGLVEPPSGTKRGVQLTRQGHAPPGLPLLGRIAAGQPIEAVEDARPLPIPPELHGGKADYVLEVRGDSMRDAGILDGDRVLVQHRDHARNGDMVVALIDGNEATLKTIRQSADAVTLLPANPAYPPQHYHPDRVRIQGVVVALVRTYQKIL